MGPTPSCSPARTSPLSRSSESARSVSPSSELRSSAARTRGSSTSRRRCTRRASRRRVRRSSVERARGTSCAGCRHRRTCADSRRSAAGSRIRRTSSVSASSCGKTTSAGSSAWPRSSPISTAPASWESSSGASATAPRHGAKGLEFEAVFVARVEEKELPTKLAKTPAAIDEERRLFYVGLTRAKRHLFVTWTGAPSRFLRELGLQPRQTARREPEPDDPVFAALKQWRLERARANEVPAYVVFHNSTLAEIAGRKPQTLRDLATVPGVGPTKLDRYGDDVLSVLNR